MLERRRFFGQDSGPVKDNVMVFTYDDPGSDTQVALFTSPFFDDNEVTLSYNTYLDGSNLGEVSEITLTGGSSHTVELHWFGNISSNYSDVFRLWLTTGPLFTLDCSRMEFNGCDFVLHGDARLKHLILNNLNIRAFSGMQLGVANSANGEFCKIEMNNTCLSNFSANVLGHLECKNTIFARNGSDDWYPIMLDAYYSDTLDLSKVSFLGEVFKCRISLTNSSNLRNIYINLDPNQLIIKNEPWTFTGNESTTVYYNSNYNYNVIADVFPNWNLVPINLGNISPTSLEISVPSEISAMTTSFTCTYTLFYSEGFTKTGTFTWTTEQNTTSSPIVKTVTFSLEGLTATANFTHSALTTIPGSLNRSEVKAGDVYCVNGEDVGFFRYNNYVGEVIGVCVIPPSHDVYGNGCGAIISTRAVNYYDTTGSQVPTRYYPGATKMSNSYNTMYSFGTIGNQSTTAVSSTTNDSYLDTGYAFASDMFASTGTPCLNDSNSGYYSMLGNRSEYILPSPYLTDGSRNNAYSSGTNSFIRFDGKEKTEYAITHGTSGTSYNNDPVAFACHNYGGLSGIRKGEWYMPDLGEIGYLAARLKTIRETFQFLINKGCEVSDLNSGYETYGDAYGVLSFMGIISNQYSGYTSDYHARYFSWSEGRIRHARYNSYKLAAHAFLQV